MAIVNLYTAAVKTFLNNIEQVRQSIKEVPISNAKDYKIRLSAMLKANDIDPEIVDWDLIKEMFDYVRPIQHSILLL